jgi:transcriptional regulator with XRE-family HTH domain
MGRRVAELRAERGLTQETLAEKLGVSGVYVRRVELGRENLTIRSVARFAAMLAVRTADLFVPPASREVRVGRPRRAPSKAPVASVPQAPDDETAAGATAPQEAPAPPESDGTPR